MIITSITKCTSRTFSTVLGYVGGMKQYLYMQWNLELRKESVLPRQQIRKIQYYYHLIRY
jgi:hypothetical protein